MHIRMQETSDSANLLHSLAAQMAIMTMTDREIYRIIPLVEMSSTSRFKVVTAFVDCELSPWPLPSSYATYICGNILILTHNNRMNCSCVLLDRKVGKIQRQITRKKVQTWPMATTISVPRCQKTNQ